MMKKMISSKDEDRLSALPYGLQRHIVSFLPMKEIAKTAVLSKFWRMIWRSTPIISFDYDQFPEREDKLDHFRRIVDQTLAHHDDSDIENFKLYLSIHEHNPLEYRQENAINNGWINFAISRNVQKLSVHGNFDRLTSFPTTFFTCKSLVEIDLALARFTFELPPNAFLPNLKKADLKMMKLTEKSFPKDLSVICPLLEEMAIRCCVLTDLKVLSISASKLKVLILNDCDNIQKCTVHVRSSSLLGFVTLEGIAKEYILETPNLWYASANIGHSDIMLSIEELSRSLMKLVQRISKVQQIWFNHTSIEVLSHARALWDSYDSVLFCNLEKLELDFLPTIHHHVEMVLLILQRCPNIVHLDIVMQRLRGEAMEIPNPESNWQNMSLVLNKLCRVNIHHFKAEENEMVLVKFLLTNSPNLRHRKMFRISPLGVVSKLTLVSDYGDEYVNACSGYAVVLSLTSH